MSRFWSGKKDCHRHPLSLINCTKITPKAQLLSCSNGKVTPPNEDPETQGHDLRDSDTFGKIVSTFSEVQKRCKLFRSKCHKRIVYGSMSWMTLKYHGTKYRSKSILRWRTKKKVWFRLALFSRSTFIDTWYNMKKCFFWQWIECTCNLKGVHVLVAKEIVSVFPNHLSSARKSLLRQLSDGWSIITETHVILIISIDMVVRKYKDNLEWYGLITWKRPNGGHYS